MKTRNKRKQELELIPKPPIGKIVNPCVMKGTPAKDPLAHLKKLSKPDGLRFFVPSVVIEAFCMQIALYCQGTRLDRSDNEISPFHYKTTNQAYFYYEMGFRVAERLCQVATESEKDEFTI